MKSRLKRLDSDSREEAAAAMAQHVGNSRDDGPRFTAEDHRLPFGARARMILLLALLGWVIIGTGLALLVS